MNSFQTIDFRHRNDQFPFQSKALIINVLRNLSWFMLLYCYYYYSLVNWWFWLKSEVRKYQLLKRDECITTLLCMCLCIVNDIETNKWWKRSYDISVQLKMVMIWNVTTTYFYQHYMNINSYFDVRQDQRNIFCFVVYINLIAQIYSYKIETEFMKSQ